MRVDTSQVKNRGMAFCAIGIQLQPVNHEAFNSVGALLFALDADKLMRKPSHVGCFRSSHVNRFRETGFKLASDVVDAIDQNLVRSSPHEYAFDHLVKAGEPVSRR